MAVYQKGGLDTPTQLENLKLTQDLLVLGFPYETTKSNQITDPHRDLFCVLLQYILYRRTHFHIVHAL